MTIDVTQVYNPPINQEEDSQGQEFLIKIYFLRTLLHSDRLLFSQPQ